MFKKIILTSAVIALVLSTGTVWAKRGTDDEFSLPRNAKKVSENVYDLGVSVDALSGKQVRGKAFVHNPRTESTVNAVSTCYGFIGDGVTWKTNENFLFNAKNRSGLSQSTLLSRFNADLGTWESAANANIVGTAALTSSRLRADTSYPDGRNEIYFAGVSGGSIAVTIIWYTTTTNEIVETDQVYNDRTYRWSLNGDPNRMDFDNIATHENGHIMGLNDQYDSGCSEVTMYGYADYGETKKQTLETPDVTGINALY